MVEPEGDNRYDELAQLAFSGGLAPDQDDEPGPIVQRASTSSSPADSRTPPTPPEVAQIADEPARRIGHYIKVRELGEGGFGTVWLAWDTRLSRFVALKFLKAQSSDDVARFRREASLSAGLSHPNIASVYEVADGPPYIAMQFVDGQPASDLTPSPQDALRIIKSAAEAVHFAHENGVIHRDLKPQNIMVDKTGRVFVMDFGLAKRVDVEAKQTSVLMGTPHFMSPEQAMGEPVDRRSDVFSLGSTLYAVIAGAPPFTGKQIDILRAVIDREPPPLKRVDADVRTIIAKAMEKEPARRYRTAADLGADIGRYLAGEPIVARPVSFVTRIVKRVRRNPVPFIVGAVGAVALGIALGYLIPRLAGAERRSKESQAVAKRENERMLDQLRKRTEELLDAALRLRRAGDLRGMGEFSRKTEDVCGQAIKEMPDRPEPHYHLGRMYRAMMNYGKALEQQNLALSKEPAFGPSLYERIVLLARLHANRLVVLESELRALEGTRRAKTGLGNMTFPESVGFIVPNVAGLEKKDQALGDLKRRLRQDVASLGRAPGITDSEQKAAEGFALASSREFRKAENSLQHAVRQNPLLEEARETLLRLAIDQIALVPLKQAREIYSCALAESDQALQADKGYLPHYVARARLQFNYGFVMSSARTDPVPYYSEARKACGDALALRADHLDALEQRSTICGTWADCEARSGRDPGDLYQQSISDADELIKQGRDSTDARVLRAVAQLNWAEHLEFSGEPFTDLLSAALRGLDEAIQRDSRSSIAYFNRANVLALFAEAPDLRDDERRGFYEKAIADCSSAKELDPTVAGPIVSRAYVRLNWASWIIQSKTGDPNELLSLAIADCKAALELSSIESEANLVLAQAHLQLGMYQRDTGADPSGSFNEAIKNFDATIDADQFCVEAWLNRAVAKVNLALWKEKGGVDPFPWISSAVEDLTEAVERNPKYAEAYWRRGWCLGKLQEWEKAVQDFEKAASLNSSLVPRFKSFWDTAKSRLSDY